MYIYLSEGSFNPGTAGQTLHLSNVADPEILKREGYSGIKKGGF